MQIFEYPDRLIFFIFSFPILFFSFSVKIFCLIIYLFISALCLLAYMLGKKYLFIDLVCIDKVCNFALAFGSERRSLSGSIEGLLPVSLGEVIKRVP